MLPCCQVMMWVSVAGEMKSGVSQASSPSMLFLHGALAAHRGSGLGLGKECCPKTGKKIEKEKEGHILLRVHSTPGTVLIVLVNPQSYLQDRASKLIYRS